MSIERFCRKEVATIQPRDTVARAARTMMEKHVGALVVVDDNRRLLGMITDRDITCRVVAAMRDPGTTSVESAMSRDLVTVREDETRRSRLLHAQPRRPAATRGRRGGQAHRSGRLRRHGRPPLEGD